MTFEEAIQIFKEKEVIEDSLILIGKDKLADELRLIIASWGKVNITRLPLSEKPNKNIKDCDIWKWLWGCISYSHKDVSILTGIKIGVEQRIEMLIANRLIYPDGSISDKAQKAIRQYLKIQLDL